LAGNESQWPGQYPRDGWYADPQGPAVADDGPPTAAQDTPTAAQEPPPAAQDTPPAAPVPPAAGQAPPAGAAAPPASPYTPPPAPNGAPGSPYGPPAPPAPSLPPPAAPYGYPGPPAASYAWPPAPHIPPGGYQVPPAGYHAPNGGYPFPPGGGYQVQARVSPGMMHPGMSAGMRAATPDRERAVDVLKAGFAEGRLSQEEYNLRMGQAYSAKTYGELAALTADLPAGAMPTAWPVPVYQPPASTNSLARASLVLGVAEFFTMGLTAIPAIICGHMAKKEMRQTGQRGDGLATSGLVLGYMAVIFWGILIALSIVSVVITSTGTGG
jgi:Domain of unknown function (DUF1707)/Domain of unknown function (DUF4190)